MWADLSDSLRRRIVFAALLAPLAVAAYLRVTRMSLLDIFEDGYHHWWIGGHLAETGAYLDPMSKMTEGNWLPGYYPIVATVYSAARWGAVDILRWASLAASLATVWAIFRATRPHGLLAAFVAALFYALTIQASLIGSMAIPEPIVVLAVFLAAYLLYSSAWASERRRLLIASLLLLVAATLRYEAWAAVALVPFHAWTVRRDFVRKSWWAVAPSAAFALAWVLFLLPQGALPSIVLGQTAREAQNQITLGNLLSTPWDRWWNFWFNNYAIGLLPLYVFGPGYMLLRQRREYGTWLALGLFMGVSVLVSAGLGTGSYRYVAIAVPFIAVSAGRAASALVLRIPKIGPAPRPWLVGAAVGIIVVASVANTAWITPRVDSVGQLHDPLRRAGMWISEQPWPAGKRLLSDSPIAAYYSHVDPALAWSSWWLPSDRSEAVALLRSEYAYVVFVNVSYYPLAQLFPELRGGANTTDFTLAYNPNGWELQYGAKEVFVYQVRA